MNIFYKRNYKKNLARSADAASYLEQKGYRQTIEQRSWIFRIGIFLLSLGIF